MLVTLAVLLLMMTVIVQIFRAATGALNSAQVYQELDNQFRRLDGMIRSDLAGVTCKLTPPNDPKNNPGYLEYGENDFADAQGEDSDDYIRFTAKAPAGRPFTGRMWVPPPNPANLNLGLSQNQAQNLFLAGYQPITITSDYAEIIYFLRNGNLYRRVLLVSPERQSVITPTINNTAYVAYTNDKSTPASFTFNPVGLNKDQVSWQSMNDLSAHPAPTGPDPKGLNTYNSIILNSLADLTNRENRFAYQRFANDFNDLGAKGAPDNVVDDFNGDNVPDYYPTLYSFSTGNPPRSVFTNPNKLIFEPQTYGKQVPAFRNLMAFPFVYPGAYSRPQTLGTGANANNTNYGWIHSPEPSVVDSAGNVYQFDVSPLNYLQNLNHNPIDVGDNLPPPSSGNHGDQTWWCLPTWRETLSPSWTDPTWQVNTNQSQPFGLAYQPASGQFGNVLQFLPDMTSLYRINPQPYNDGLPTNANPNPVPNDFFPLTGTPATVPDLWLRSWEDDLIMTGVRSFDIKAYDNSLGAYADLGWGDDPRLTVQLTPAYLGISSTLATPPYLIPYLAGNYDPVNGYVPAPAAYINDNKYDLLGQTFAHEGRMPPLVNDNRFDSQYGLAASYLPSNSPYLLPNGTYTGYTGNIGDDQVGIFRLRRVWDSWSTEYTRAPGTGVDNSTGFPVGPPYTPPVYPSYPPPYPAPLRGIQIQIRVTDPTNQRIKTLTIRQDFTDKL